MIFHSRKEAIQLFLFRKVTLPAAVLIEEGNAQPGMKLLFLLLA